MGKRTKSDENACEGEKRRLRRPTWVSSNGEGRAPRQARLKLRSFLLFKQQLSLFRRKTFSFQTKILTFQKKKLSLFSDI